MLSGYFVLRSYEKKGPAKFLSGRFNRIYSDKPGKGLKCLHNRYLPKQYAALRLEYRPAVVPRSIADFFRVLHYFPADF